MRFVDLNRYLAPIKDAPDFGDGDSGYWGKRYGGWIQWPQLVAHRRVVILAGAGSGKTEEFKQQTRIQRALGRATFFVRLEELADTPFENAIDHQLSSEFSVWLNEQEPGWFFLDAVDELKLRGKKLDAALRGISQALRGSLKRAHIFISSRPTDWDWRTDPISLADRLRPPVEQSIEQETDRDAALLAPLERSSRRGEKKEVLDEFEIKTFRLADLDNDQVCQLAEANGIQPGKPFLDAVVLNNLGALTQTPLDVEVLIRYWKERRRLNRLAQMVEYVVDQKLVEIEAKRPDNDVLSREEARNGAARIAAALTFNKSLSLRFSQGDAHPTLDEASLDVVNVLPDRTDAQREALIRRGIFVPATFGRVRFHHRQTQDYLTSVWLDRLMRDGTGTSAIIRLAFPRTYDEEVVVPSLVAALCWLALKQPCIREFLIERQPLALIQGGDPSSLTIDVKSRLLCRYAELHREGKAPNDVILNRQLALFADAGLAQTIRGIWDSEPAGDVRFQLLRIIGEAKIIYCVDLCAEVAFNDLAEDYHRVIAAEALASCNATKQLGQLADRLLQTCATMQEQVCCGFALRLFPRYLNARQLAAIIDRTPSSKRGRSDGFANKLDEFLAACASQDERQALLMEFVRLCRQKPLSGDYKRVSAKHSGIAEHLGPLVRDGLRRLSPQDCPTAALVRALGVLQWVDDREEQEEDEQLALLVRRNNSLNRSLYWHSLIEDRLQNPDRANEHWQLLPWRSHRQFWSLSSNDWSWLIFDVKSARQFKNRRAALVAAHNLVDHKLAPDDAADQLRAVTNGAPDLKSALEELSACSSLGDRQRREDRSRRRRECKSKIRQIRTERNWQAFRDRLSANPESLTQLQRLTSSNNIQDLRVLTDWLSKPKGSLDREIRLEWRRLELPFGVAVAQAYRDGMRLLWRNTAPARPSRSDGGAISTPWKNLLSFHGVLIEARQADDWVANLSDIEVECAAGHLLLTEQGITDELIKIASARPEIVKPIIEAEFAREWREPATWRQLLNHLAGHTDDLRRMLAPRLLEFLTNEAPEDSDIYDTAIGIIGDMDIDGSGSELLRAAALQRFAANNNAGNEDGVLRAIALLYLVDPLSALTKTKQWLGLTSEPGRNEKAERFFAALFGRDRSLVSRRLAKMPVEVADELYRLCLSWIRFTHDLDHGGGVYTPNIRDHAEAARNRFLNDIIGRKDRASYEVLLRFGNERLWGDRSYRAFEVARERAEKDSEIQAWSAAETIEFERKRLAPIKSGADLFNLIHELLDDIQKGFDRDDATSRDLVALAPDEDHLQNWLAERLNERSKGQFHAFREPRVSDKKRSDVVIAAASCTAQLVIEVKHGGKGWTLTDFEKALVTQLGGQYLKPHNRRHGILLITNHTRSYWICPTTAEHLDFTSVLKRLNEFAAAVDRDFQVIAVGLDVSRTENKVSGVVAH